MLLATASRTHLQPTMTILNGTDREQETTNQENNLLILIITYSMLTTLNLGAGTILSAAAYAKFQKEITILDEVAERPLPQDDTTAAEVMSGDTPFHLAFLTPLTSALTIPLTPSLTSPCTADSLNNPS